MPRFALLFVLALAAPQPKATRVLVRKTAHELVLYRGDTVLHRYRVAIGPGGPGFKHREGDKVTPVGHYHVTMHQPSRYHEFLLGCVAVDDAEIDEIGSLVADGTPLDLED